DAVVLRLVGPARTLFRWRLAGPRQHRLEAGCLRRRLGGRCGGLLLPPRPVRVPFAPATLSSGDLLHRPTRRHGRRHLLRDVGPAVRMLVAMFDEQPLRADPALDRVRANERERTLQALTVEGDRELPGPILPQDGFLVRLSFAGFVGRIGAPIPEHDGPHAVLAHRDRPLEVVVLDRTFLDLHGEAPGRRILARSLRNRPAPHHAFHLQAEVVVQVGSRVLLDDKAQRRAASPPTRAAGGLGGLLEIPLLLILLERLPRSAFRHPTLPVAANRGHQLFLVHLAPPRDIQLFRTIVQFVPTPSLQPAVRITGSLRRPVRRAALGPSLLVHRAGGDLLRTLRRSSPLHLALLHVLVLALVLVAPGWHLSSSRARLMSSRPTASD